MWRGEEGERGNIGGVVAVGEPASGTTMHSAMGKGNRKGDGGWRGNWLLKHIVNRLHNELRLLFETGRWKLRRKCNRRDVEEERKATRREEERRKREGNNSNESYELKLLNQMN